MQIGHCAIVRMWFKINTELFINNGFHLKCSGRVWNKIIFGQKYLLQDKLDAEEIIAKVQFKCIKVNPVTITSARTRYRTGHVKAATFRTWYGCFYINMYILYIQDDLVNHKYDVWIVFFCLFDRPTREFFTHMETSPLPLKGCKFWHMIGTYAWPLSNEPV